MTVEYELIDITPENVDDYDLLCYKSKKKTAGYQNKLSWFNDRYGEGLRMKLLIVNDHGKMTSRGFIEYIPGEYTWRAINAPNYNVVHCLWVIGKWKKMGFGRMLIEACVEDTKNAGKDGCVAVTSEGNWLVHRKVFLKNGFELVDEAPPSFSLLVHKFSNGTDPRFPTDWEERAKRFGEGLTVIYTDQCPYQIDAVNEVQKYANEESIKFTAVRISDAKEIRDRSPSAYGVFGIVYEGRLLSYCYQKKSQLHKLIHG